VNTDIRLSLTFKGHRKRRKLRVLLGDNATDYLLDLWLSAAQDRPDGTLTGWGPVDVALAAGWEGDAEKFTQSMVAAGLLEMLDGEYHLHDWEQHQPWACNAKERSEAGRRAANIRYERNGTHAERMRSACPPQCGTHAPSPSPSPSPSPKRKSKSSPIAEPIEPTTPQQKPQQNIFDHWNQQDIIKHRAMTKAVKGHLNSALVNYSQDEVTQAIDNYAKILASPEHYFKYKWTLKDFLTRGLDKFYDWKVCDANYAKGDNGYEANRGSVRKLPKVYTEAPDYGPDAFKIE